MCLNTVCKSCGLPEAVFCLSVLSVSFELTLNLLASRARYLDNHDPNHKVARHA